MKKEVFLAIIFGVVVGLIVMFGIYTANSALKQSSATKINDLDATPSSLLEQTTQPDLTILSPEDGLLTEESTITLTGTTFPNATVIVFVNQQDQIVYADQTGNFSAELSLEGGSNVIETTTISSTGAQSSDKRTIVFSTADLDAPVSTISATIQDTEDDL